MNAQGKIFIENGMTVTQLNFTDQPTGIKWELSYKAIGCNRYSVTIGCTEHGIVYYDMDSGLDSLNHILTDVVRFANVRLDFYNWSN